MKLAAAAMLTALLALAPAARAETQAGDQANPEQPSEAWTYLREEVFPGRSVQDAGDMIRLDAPYRAHDAAIVPVEIEIAPPFGRTVRHVTLIIDENPAPVAGEFDIGPAMGQSVFLSTRVRVNAYSNVRVVAELDDGALYQSARFVKATGGCAAPALKDADAALAAAGQMRLRVFDFAAAAAQAARPPSTRHEAQLMVRHPNYSGFQMDQVTQLYIPPFFVDEIEVRQGEDLVFRVVGGISLSEDPSIRFAFIPNGASAFSVHATDTDGGVYEGSFPVATGS
jgi:sulfur-oxidizing protein SoxY